MQFSYGGDGIASYVVYFETNNCYVARFGLHKKIQALEAEKGAKRQVSDDAVIEQPPVFMEQLKDIGLVAEGTDILLEFR